MAYTKTNWINGSTPAINATNLNKIETELEALDTGVSTANSNIGTLSELETEEKASLVDAINEVNDKTQISYSTTETQIGTWIDGSPVYRRAINSTVGNIRSVLTSIGIDKLLQVNLWAKSNYNNYFPIPNNSWNVGTGYAIDLFFSTTGVSVYFQNYYNSDNEVYGYIEYTKTTA